MKKKGQRIIRNFHRLFFKKNLPDNIAIYFHSLEKKDYDSFEQLVTFLKNKKYEITDPGSFSKNFFSKSVFLSFDDNYQTWYKAIDLFDKLQIKVTFYTNTFPLRDRATQNQIQSFFNIIKYQEAGSTLSSEEIKALFDAGHTIGSHTHSHRDLSQMPINEAQEEIRKGKEILESIIGESVVHFSYPFGMRRYFKKSLIPFCNSCGIKTIAAAIPGLQQTIRKHPIINRSGWNFNYSFEHNLENIMIDGRLFEKITGKSAVG